MRPATFRARPDVAHSAADVNDGEGARRERVACSLSTAEVGSHYTMDELRDIATSGVAAAVPPDADTLVAQLQWDLGVSQALDQIKNSQLREQREANRAMASGTSGRHGRRASDTRMGSTFNQQGSKFGKELSKRISFEGLAHTAELSRSRKYIVHPGRTFTIVWDGVVFSAVVWSVFVTPLISCNMADQTLLITGMNALVDSVLATDVLFTFFRAYEDDLRDIVVTSPRSIAWRYLTSWFLIDMFGALPFDLIFMGMFGQDDTTGRTLRIIKLVRVLRILKPREGVGFQIDPSMNPSLVALAKLIFSLVLLWHWVACLYWKVSMDAIEALKEPDVFFSVIPWQPQESVIKGGLGVRYLHSFTWSIGVTCQIFRPEPTTVSEQLFTNFIVIMGFLAMAVIIGAATTVIADIQSQKAETSSRLQRISRYMRYKRLPETLRRRVLSFYKFQYTSMNMIDESSVLGGLPRPLKMQMQLVLHSPLFVQLPLFWMCSERELLFLVQRLRACLAMPGEMLIREGDVGVGIFFLMKGAVETMSHGYLASVLLAISAFGETALRGEKSQSTTSALRFCEMSVLLTADFAHVEMLNPQIKKWIDMYIKERDAQFKDKKTRRNSSDTRVAAVTRACRDWASHDVCNRTFKERQSNDKPGLERTNTSALAEAIRAPHMGGAAKRLMSTYEASRVAAARGHITARIRSLSSKQSAEAQESDTESKLEQFFSTKNLLANAPASDTKVTVSSEPTGKYDRNESRPEPPKRVPSSKRMPPQADIVTRTMHRQPSEKHSVTWPTDTIVPSMAHVNGCAKGPAFKPKTNCTNGTHAHAANLVV